MTSWRPAEPASTPPTATPAGAANLCWPGCWATTGTRWCWPPRSGSRTPARTTPHHCRCRVSAGAWPAACTAWTPTTSTCTTCTSPTELRRSDTLTVLQELLDNGDIRAWGVSNFATWQIAELRYTAADLGIPDPVIAQQIYNVVATRLDDEYAEYASVTSLPTVIYNPLAGGLLTGKHSPREDPPTGRFGGTGLGAGPSRRPPEAGPRDAASARTSGSADSTRSRAPENLSGPALAGGPP